MATKKNSRPKKKFCVWADYVRRVYQHVTADFPQQALDIATKRVECWDPCDTHDGNGLLGLRQGGGGQVVVDARGLRAAGEQYAGRDSHQPVPRFPTRHDATQPIPRSWRMIARRENGTNTIVSPQMLLGSAAVEYLPLQMSRTVLYSERPERSTRGEPRRP